MHFTLHPAREFSLASIFHSRVTFIFANLAAQQIYRWIKKTVERVHYYKLKWQHQHDRRKLGETYLFHPRWRIFVYKLNVGSSAITRPDVWGPATCAKSDRIAQRLWCEIVNVVLTSYNWAHVHLPKRHCDILIVI